MKLKSYLIIMAAGHGTRMGGDLPKQFMDLGGKPVLRRSIEKFIEAVPGIRVVTVLPHGYADWWKEYCLASSFDCPQVCVEGGITRFHSVRNALAKVPCGVVVAIHDGVRPLVSKELIQKMFSLMEDGRRALVPVTESVDSLKALRRVPRDGGGWGFEDVPGLKVDRSLTFGAQTPQLFISDDIKAAYGQAYDTAFTDDASVAAKKGIPLTYVEGERYNLKITRPEDLLLAKALIPSP